MEGGKVYILLFSYLKLFSHEKRILTIGLLLSVLSIVIAQKNKDYILTLRKDTLFGKIKTNFQSELITFIYKRKKVYFHPSTIKSYGIYDRRKYLRFKSIKNSSGDWLFVQILDEGKVKLYRYKRYVTTTEATYLKDLYYIGRSDDRLISIKRETFEQVMKGLILHHPSLLPQVNESTFKDVPAIVASYNRL